MKTSKTSVATPVRNSDRARTRATKPRMRQAVERLENRRLLAAIEGNFFVDEDGDGLLDFFEVGAPDVTVFLDQNGNRTLDDGELSTVTNDNGFYRFNDLPVGDYFLTHVFETEGVRLAQTSPGVAGRTNLTGDYDIDLVFVDSNLPDNLVTLVESAAALWEQAIVGDTPGGAGIDDVRIEVATVPLGFGILA
ncbi:MAG: SdrD B-like domain-containing protein, partial [Planctomycetota bacterium]